MLVSEENHKALENLKVIPRESYDGVIGRLLSNSTSRKESQEEPTTTDREPIA